jgi:hypothetical protein
MVMKEWFVHDSWEHLSPSSPLTSEFSLNNYPSPILLKLPKGTLFKWASWSIFTGHSLLELLSAPAHLDIILLLYFRLIGGYCRVF